MDSSNHQRYKSKLFNLVNRQSSQWRDRLMLSVQYLRIGVEWSLQILIYPIYLMVQAGRVIPKQLNRNLGQKALTSRNKKTVFSFAKVDQPLRRVLQETERCLTEGKSKQTRRRNKKTVLKNKSPIMVQGIASNINNNDLVLVAEDKAIIDILSEEQQKHLKKYIRLEVANYWYDFKQQNKKYNLGLIHKFSTKDNNILPPIRWFWQVMGWMQTGTLAMNLDLFRESTLVPVVASNRTTTTTTSLSTNSQLSWQENSINSLQVSTSLSEKIQQLREHIKHKSNEALNIENEDPFRVEFLIYAAIDYFFNQIIPHKQLTSDVPQEQLKLSTVSYLGFIPETIDDPWLSGDVLEQEVSAVNITSSFQSYPLLAQSDTSSHQVKKSFKQNSKRKVNTAKKGKKLGKSKSLAKSQKNKKSIKIISKDKIERISSHCIETEAKTTGYIKHPLVRILEWLDSAIHWLENLVNKLSRLLRKKR
ncbi:MAG: hypothetical protein AB4060_07725 [Crocosphaera sp.]